MSNIFQMDHSKHGTIRIEEWPEGLVLWIGGQIRWRSWEDKAPPSQDITLHLRCSFEVKE
jgi:hypothetical protein